MKLRPSILELACVGILLTTALFVHRLATQRSRWETCANPDRIVDTREIDGTSSVLAADTGSSDHLFARVHGRIESSDQNVRYQVLRSDDPFSLTFDWVRMVGNGLVDPVRRWTERVEFEGRDVPIRWAETLYGAEKRLIGRVEVFRGEPITSVLFSELLAIPDQGIRGRLPLTIYLVESAVETRDEAVVRRIAKEWLVSALRHHRSVCAP